MFIPTFGKCATSEANVLLLGVAISYQVNREHEKKDPRVIHPWVLNATYVVLLITSSC